MAYSIPNLSDRMSLDDIVTGIANGGSPLSTTRMPGSAPTPTNGLSGSNPSSQARMQSILDMIGSPGGQALTNFAGAGLSAYGQAQQGEANRQQSATQFAASAKQNQFNADRQDQLSRANGVLNADPLGADQGYAQKNALMAAILPQARNARSTPGDSRVASAMGTRTGGISNLLPEGGLDPAMIDAMFGQKATAGAITQRHQEINSLDPNAAQPNFAGMGFNADVAQNAQSTVAGWAQQLQQKTGADKAAFEQELNGYLKQMVDQESDTGGFWHKFAKVAGVVGMVAATVLTAGAAAPLTGTALAGMVGLGAASGAASAWGSGGSPLMGAITGGAGSYAGAKVKK